MPTSRPYLSPVTDALLRRAHAVHPITAVQSEYSLWTRDVEALTPVLAEALRKQGFAVAEGLAPAGSHTLRYWITPLDGSGELVRLLIDGRKEAARFFVRDTGGMLQTGGPFTVMQVEASR